MRECNQNCTWSARSFIANSISRDHVAELNSARPKQPFFFLKPSTSILLQGEGPVIRPKGVELSYEIELALIMGKDLKDVEVSDEKTIFDAIDSRSPHVIRNKAVQNLMIFPRLCSQH